MSTYDSDTSFETEVVYNEKRPTTHMPKVLVPNTSIIISEVETTYVKPYSASKAIFKCWIDEATLSFGYSPTTKKKRPSLPNNPKRAWQPKPVMC